MTAMVVADASALIEYVLRTPTGDVLSAHLEDARLAVAIPHSCDVEVVAACRKAVMAGKLAPARAAEALADYLDLPLERYGDPGFVPRLWELRDNFSPYDAVYVALAEALESPLLTADRRLGRATAEHTTVSVIPVPMP